MEMCVVYDCTCNGPGSPVENIKASNTNSTYIHKTMISWWMLKKMVGEIFNDVIIVFLECAWSV